MSGSVFAAWTTSERVVNDTYQLGHLLGCDVEESVELKACLKTKSYDQIYDAINITGSTRMDVNFVKFGPRFDGVFFPRDYPN
uniref:Carboxylesterase type B domain-containing protein n=1 Tax=Ditylenchus dipsaci TaxID=166011 RepID=A0A915CLV9_9BILA